jgi:ribose transport system permease protein
MTSAIVERRPAACASRIHGPSGRAFMLLVREAPTSAPAAASRRRFAWSQASIVACLAAAMFVALSIFLSGFLNPNNLINLVRNVAVLGILGIGMATVVIGRGIDLSMVPIMAVSVALLFVLVSSGVATPLAVLLAAGAALLCGAANGALIAYVEIPPLFTTLAMGTMALGLGQFFVFSNVSVIAPKAIGWLSELGGGKVAGVPISVFLLLAIAAAAHLFLNYTYSGRYIFAIGDNPSAARNGGVPVRPLIVAHYAIVALLAFFAGLIMATAVNEMNTRIVYSTLPYDVILVVVIGGVGLSGGKGGVRNVLVGTLLIGILSNGMTIMNLSYTNQKIIQSMVLLLAIVIDGILNPRDEQTSQQGDI